MYAILEIGGRQYQVSEGQTIQVNRLSAAEKDAVYLGGVRLIHSDEGLSLDPSVLSVAKVRAVVQRNLRGPKVRVFKTKRRTGFQKTRGHRQELTELLITDILPKGAEDQRESSEDEVVLDLAKSSDDAQAQVQAHDALDASSQVDAEQGISEQGDLEAKAQDQSSQDQVAASQDDVESNLEDQNDEELNKDREE
jgi:large subunit ribosomal protein L21